MKYKATERAWVMRLLARLTPDQRRRYEEEMRREPGHHSTGKKYDGLKAQVAERIMLEDSLLRRNSPDATLKPGDRVGPWVVGDVFTIPVPKP